MAIGNWKYFPFLIHFFLFLSLQSFTVKIFFCVHCPSFDLFTTVHLFHSRCSLVIFNELCYFLLLYRHEKLFGFLFISVGKLTLICWSVLIVYFSGFFFVCVWGGVEGVSDGHLLWFAPLLLIPIFCLQEWSHEVHKEVDFFFPLSDVWHTSARILVKKKTTFGTFFFNKKYGAIYEFTFNAMRSFNFLFSSVVALI